MREHGVGPDDLDRMVAVIANEENCLTGADQSMPGINMRYLLAVSLLDGDLTFEAGHDVQRMTDRKVVDITNRIEVRADPSLITPESPRQGVIEFSSKDGLEFRNHVVVVRGAMESPLTSDEVEAKERDLLTGVLGQDRTARLITAIWDLESLQSVRDLRSLLTA